MYVKFKEKRKWVLSLFFSIVLFIYMQHIFLLAIGSQSSIFLRKFPQHLDLENQREEIKLAPKKNSISNQINHGVLKEYKTIGFWSKTLGNRKYWLTLFQRQYNNECEEKRCKLLVEDEWEIAKADAVVFNAYDLDTKDKPSDPLPPTRASDQFYVFYTHEAGPRIDEKQIQLQNYDNFFNWTMNFRTDSDIVVPYGRVTKRLKKRPRWEVKYVTDWELKSRKMGIWISSHCLVPSRRKVFIELLKGFMSIDSYGECGDKTCGIPTHVGYVDEDIDSDPCNNLIMNYTFYLSLENSLCNEYVTEKFYRPLKLGIIPIVLGGANYSEFAPPKSYIDVKEFKNFAAFKKHVNEVASSAKLYNEYLRWREDYDIEMGLPYKPFVCGLCQKLHNKSATSIRKTYSSIDDWVHKETSCYSLKEMIP